MCQSGCRTHFILCARVRVARAISSIHAFDQPNPTPSDLCRQTEIEMWTRSRWRAKGKYTHWNIWYYYNRHYAFCTTLCSPCALCSSQRMLFVYRRLACYHWQNKIINLYSALYTCINVSWGTAVSPWRQITCTLHTVRFQVAWSMDHQTYGMISLWPTRFPH